MALAESSPGRKPWQFWKRSAAPTPIFERPVEEIAGSIVESAQRLTEEWLQKQVVEEKAKNYRTPQQRFQESVGIWVTYGIEYRPAPLMGQMRSFAATAEGGEDMLTVHAHLATLDYISQVRQGVNPNEAFAELQDVADAVQQVRENPTLPKYFTHKAMVQRVLEPRISGRASDRLLKEVELYSRLRTVDTGGRHWDYAL